MTSGLASDALESRPPGGASAEPPAGGMEKPRVRAVGPKRPPAGALIGLCRAVLMRTPLARTGRFLMLGVTLFLVVSAIVLRAEDGRRAQLEGLIIHAATWSTWLAAGAILLAASRPVESLSTFDFLVWTRGGGEPAVHAGIALGAVVEVALAIAVPVLVVGGLAIALAPSPVVLGRRVLITAVCLGFALVAGACLGGLAGVCARLFGKSGRAGFALLVVGPWIVASFVGRPGYSIPGALRALLSLGFELAGVRW